MKVRVVYNKDAFNATVEFIAKNNPYFIGKHDEIRKSLLNTIARIIETDIKYSGTMGYQVSVISARNEGIDEDENYRHLEFQVDPNLGSNREESEYVETIYDTNKKGSI